MAFLSISSAFQQFCLGDYSPELKLRVQTVQGANAMASKGKTYFLLQSVLWPPCENFREPKGKRFSFFCPFSDEEGGERGREPNFPLPPQSFSAFPLGRHSTAAPTMERRRNSSAETIVLRRSSAHPFVPPPKSIPPGSDLFLCPKVQHCSVAGKRGGAL